jgi:hypothetical protein
MIAVQKVHQQKQGYAQIEDHLQRFRFGEQAEEPLPKVLIRGGQHP